jgi:hypothetical protein
MRGRTSLFLDRHSSTWVITLTLFALFLVVYSLIILVAFSYFSGKVFCFLPRPTWIKSSYLSFPARLGWYTLLQPAFLLRCGFSLIACFETDLPLLCLPSSYNYKCEAWWSGSSGRSFCLASVRSIKQKKKTQVWASELTCW